MKALPRSWYEENDVVHIARHLLGKALWFQAAEGLRGGIITETEAYAAVHDRACHAAGGRRTPRNEVMFGEAGRAYVYRCYGIHLLLNVVTGPIGSAQAVLIRALRPFQGECNGRVASGPGKLTKYLGIESSHNGIDLCGNTLWVTEGETVADDAVVFTTRIGVAYAGSDALLPYRCYIRGEESVSRPLFPKYPLQI